MTAPAAESLDLADAAMQSLASEMIEVHGAGAAAIARENARLAAVAARLPQAKRWLRVLDQIQQQHRLKETTRPRGPELPSATHPEHEGA